MKEAIQRDCTRYAPGIEIIGVRVTKPKIPASIARNYEIMEEERTKVFNLPLLPCSELIQLQLVKQFSFQITSSNSRVLVSYHGGQSIFHWIKFCV
jgi:hypothetical protein